MSTVVRRGTENFPPEWSRLEQAAEDAGGLLERLVRRAHAAEEEVQRLRRSLEEVAEGRAIATEDSAQQIRQLKAENAALRSRLQQARKHVSGLMQRLATLEIDHE